jgi:hypothetical protein
MKERGDAGMSKLTLLLGFLFFLGFHVALFRKSCSYGTEIGHSYALQAPLCFGELFIYKI